MIRESVVTVVESNWNNIHPNHERRRFILEIIFYEAATKVIENNQSVRKVTKDYLQPMIGYNPEYLHH